MTVAHEPCLICQPAARAALDPDVRAMMEELVAEYPPDRVPWIPCWGCLGAGYTGDTQEAIKERLRDLCRNETDREERIAAEAAGQQRLISL